MSNEHGMNETASSVEPKNPRREVEGLLEDNLQRTLKVLSLVREVGISLLGVEPIEAGSDKEAADCPGSAFARAKDTALKTRRYLGEIRDEVVEIIKAIK